jgi:hypothetical protein
MDEATLSKTRAWRDWTERMRMTDAARRDLEAFVRAAAPACRAPFDFRLTADRVESFADRMILLRAEKD